MSKLYDNIPAMLKQRRNWVAWGIRDAPLKTPFNPASLLSGKPMPAKAGISETWDSYQNAAECVKQGLAQGIGYEFDDNDDICGVDLDHVISEGSVTLQARDIVGKLASYAEISPSGTGLHIFVTAPGADIARHRKKGGFVEIYGKGRYFTVTGNIYGDTKNIACRTAELQQIHDIFLLPESEPKVVSITPAFMESDVADKRFLRQGLNRDKVFAALWSGKRRNGNESIDDQAFMNKLAYWCNANPDAMVRAFLQSPYYAQKDAAHKNKCQRLDYLPNTAKKACSSAYSTAKTDYDRWKQNRDRKRNTAR